jgi:hypothetical protein
MRDLVIYTALFGGYDQLRDPSFVDPGCDYVCFTDDPGLASKVWDVRVVASERDAQSANRHCKFFPSLYLPEYRASMYVDSNLELRGALAATVRSSLEGAAMSCARHPLRQCVYDEIACCQREGKITQAQSLALVAEFEAAGYPRKAGLYENNIIVRAHDSTEVASLMQDWWAMYERGPRRDQLSLNYLAWRHGVQIKYLPDSSRTGGRVFRYHLHSGAASMSRLRRTWLTWKARNLAVERYARLFSLLRAVRG